MNFQNTREWPSGMDIGTLAIMAANSGEMSANKRYVSFMHQNISVCLLYSVILNHFALVHLPHAVALGQTTHCIVSLKVS